MAQQNLPREQKPQRVSPICALARVSSPHLFYGCGKSVNVVFSGVERTHPAHFIARGIPVVEVEVLAEGVGNARSEEHTSELQSRGHLVCRLLLEKKNNYTKKDTEH